MSSKMKPKELVLCSYYVECNNFDCIHYYSHIPQKRCLMPKIQNWCSFANFKVRCIKAKKS